MSAVTRLPVAVTVRLVPAGSLAATSRPETNVTVPSRAETLPRSMSDVAPVAVNDTSLSEEDTLAAVIVDRVVTVTLLRAATFVNVMAGTSPSATASMLRIEIVPCEAEADSADTLVSRLMTPVVVVNVAVFATTSAVASPAPLSTMLDAAVRITLPAAPASARPINN